MWMRSNLLQVPSVTMNGGSHADTRSVPGDGGNSCWEPFLTYSVATGNRADPRASPSDLHDDALMSLPGPPVYLHSGDHCAETRGRRMGSTMGCRVSPAMTIILGVGAVRNDHPASGTGLSLTVATIAGPAYGAGFMFSRALSLSLRKISTCPCRPAPF